MPGRSPQRNTREKIRLQLLKAAKQCDIIAAQLQRIDELADGANQTITDALPTIVAFTDELKRTLVVFRESL